MTGRISGIKVDGLGPFRPAESPRGTKHRKRLPGQHVGPVAPIQGVDVRVTASNPGAPAIRGPGPSGTAPGFQMVQGLARSMIAQRSGFGNGAQSRSDVVVPVLGPVRLEPL